MSTQTETANVDAAFTSVVRRVISALFVYMILAGIALSQEIGSPFVIMTTLAVGVLLTGQSIAAKSIATLKFDATLFSVGSLIIGVVLAIAQFA